MTRLHKSLAACLVLLVLAAPLRAGHEVKTVEAAASVVHEFCAVPAHCIPAHLLREAAGVAILPHVLKAGLLVDGRVGHGVVLVRQADGTWSNPVFVTLEGIGVGGQVGIEATDLVLIFKTPHSLDRVMRGKGKLTLGNDAIIAAGPVGRDVEVATDARLKAEIVSYSHSRGLFAGVSLEGAAIKVNHRANEAFYGVHGGHPADVLTQRGNASAELLRGELTRLSGPPVVVAPPVPVPVGPPPVIVVPPPPHPHHWWQ